MEIIIAVAEPWDFTSSDGDNHIHARVIEKCEEYIIAYSLSRYFNETKYLLLKKRDIYGNYNIYGIESIINSEKTKITFSMVGKIIDKKNK